MISKVKDLIAVSEKLKDISEQVASTKTDMSNHSKDVSEFKEEIKCLKEEFVNICKETTRFSKMMQTHTTELSKTNEGLKNELFDFKRVKADIKSKLVSEIVEDVRSELRQEIQKLDVDVKRFNDLKEEMSVIVSNFRVVEDEIVKFKTIAQEIKQSDFQLARYASEVTKTDKNKLELMQKVDYLQRLIAKERRSNNSRRY